MDAKLKQELIDIVGQEHFTDNLIDLVSYSYDASHFTSRPFCGVWPRTAEQVSEILKLANRKTHPGHPPGRRYRTGRHGDSRQRAVSFWI